jgi:hypothetical protein
MQKSKASYSKMVALKGRGDCDGLNGLDAAHLTRRASRRLPEWPWGLAAIFGSLDGRGNEVQERAGHCNTRYLYGVRRILLRRIL